MREGDEDNRRFLVHRKQHRTLKDQIKYPRAQGAGPIEDSPDRSFNSVDQ